MRKLLLLLVSALFYFGAAAQVHNKKPLDHTVYDSWQSVDNEALSNNGGHVLYTVKVQQGDARLVITDASHKHILQIPRADSAVFTNNSRYAVCLIKPFYKDVRQAKIKKKKQEDFPKDSLAIVNLSTEKIKKVADVRSFKTAEHAPVVAYLSSAQTDTIKKPAAGDTSKKAIANTVAPPTREGDDLTVMQLLNGKQRTFKYVNTYQLSKNGKLLAFAVTAPKKSTVVRSGLFVYDIDRDSLKYVSTGRGNYSNLTFDRLSSQLAFTAEKNPEKALVKPFKLYYYSLLKDTADVIAGPASAGMPDRWMVSGNGKVFFSKKGDLLYFGTAPIPKPADTTIVDFEVAKLDIWNYKDDYLQPQQLKNLQRELRRSYLAVINLSANAKKTIQLGDQYIDHVFTATDNSDAPYALGLTDTGARVQAQWEGDTRTAAYLIDIKTGKRKLVSSLLRADYSISPQGQYVIWFDYKDQNWFAYSILTRKKINLTSRISTKMGEEDNDMPDYAWPYGICGWTKDDHDVLIYDRFDIWKINPANGALTNFTNGFGRANKLIFRYYRPKSSNDNERFIKDNEPLWLLTQNDDNKQWGYYKKTLSSNKPPAKVVMGGFEYSPLKKAKQGDLFIYTKQNFQHSPDLYLSTDLKKEIQLSHINPQQNNYNWGTAELVEWTTPKGYHSKGILFKPEDFDPSKKYPMLCYFYEKVSQNLYDYIAPAPTPSRLPITYFVSNGYLVFEPDISYETGHPGPSAVEFVNSGVEMLKKNPWVDGNNIGIQGQSWGGYQVAYLITATDMYKAAWAGAPVANMTSAYGGIRWETGVNRQFQYEKTQSRIGATLWERPDLYIENSPIFHLPKVHTPLVIMSNDNDGAVPWYQGIELFTGLRRLGKPVWLLQYNDEAHNLIHRRNRKDITIREQQYFDYFLKGAPMPVWMDKGVPAVDKGKDWGLGLEK